MGVSFIDGKFQTKIENFFIRYSAPGDEKIISDFIVCLGQYENLPHMLEVTPEKIHETIFEQKMAEVLIAEYMGKPVGFALFFHSYSTFLAKRGIWLEDIFICEDMRGKGFGTEVFNALIHIANERGCGRIEWSCLDWNLPSVKFYEQKMKAVKMDEWTTFRLVL